MSQYLDSLVPGKDTLDVRGPVGFIECTGDGFMVQGRWLEAAHINMIAGGTGITPMFQVIKVGGGPSVVLTGFSRSFGPSLGVRPCLLLPVFIHSLDSLLKSQQNPGYLHFLDTSSLTSVDPAAAAAALPREFG